MKKLLMSLWRGEVPLARAFWEFTVLYGTFANLLVTIAAMAAISAGHSSLLAVAIHFIPLPYNVLMLIAVWRSAGRYRGRPLLVDLARAAVILWVLAASVA